MRPLTQLLMIVISLLCMNAASIAAYDSASQSTSDQLTLLRMTPDGDDVQTQKEIVFTFDRDVVPLGRMERTAAEIPITITPSINCQWRWFSRNTLGCRLDEKDQLQPATTYTIEIKPGIVTESGVGMSETITKTIVTQRPSVESIGFRTWKASDVPVLRLTFNQPVSKKSILQSISLKPNVDVDVFPDDEYREEPLFLPMAGEKMVFVNINNKEKIKSDDQTKKQNGDEFRRNWLLQPKAGLGLDKEISVLIKPGLESAYGAMTGTENRVGVVFNTFPEFSFLGVRCYPSKSTESRIKNLHPVGVDASKNDVYTRGDGSILITPDIPLDQQPWCNPIKGAGLTFSTPVDSQQVKKYLKMLPDLAGNRKDYDPWENTSEYSQIRQPHDDGQTYTVWFPELLKAFQTYEINIGPERKGNWFVQLWERIKDYFLKIVPDNIQDQFGTVLKTTPHLSFITDHREPEYYLQYNHAVLESGVESDQPLIVTNLVSLKFNYDRMTAKQNDTNINKDVSIPKVVDIAFKIPMKIREMLGHDSGVLVGQFETNPQVNHSSYYCDRCFLTQVTPWQVHAKIGHFNSFVWVTDFAQGKPVSNAKIELFLSTQDQLASTQKIVAIAVTDKEGIAEFEGTKNFDPYLDQAVHKYAWYIKVTRGDDMALLPLTDDYHIYTPYWNNRYADEDDDESTYEGAERQKIYNHIHTWGTTAQGIYRVGDKVQYKIYVRDQNNTQFVPAPESDYTLEVKDPQGNIIHTQEDITLNEVGAFDGEFDLDKRAVVGWYNFSLTSSFAGDKVWDPMRVLVADFTPASFHVTNELNGDAYLVGDELRVSSHARLHAGGPYVDAKTRVTTSLKPAPIFTKDDQLKDFTFDNNSSNKDTITLNEIEGNLDNQGDYANTFVLPSADIVNGKLVVETSVRDDRGKNIATTASARYSGRDRYVGLRLSSWILDAGKPAGVDWAVIDDKGEMTSGAAAEIVIERQETKAAKVKGAGNAYLTEYKQEWVNVDNCKVTSTTQIQTCKFTPKEAGDYRITAKVMDTKNRQHETKVNAWVTGKNYVLWSEPDDNTLQVIPQQDTYKVGDKAKFLVKNPYPGAMAMITVERYGVMRHYLQKWDSSTPIVEVPITADDVPGFYLSIMVMSPRVAKPIDENQVDLGKPAYKIAYRQIDVIDPVKQLNVSITSDHDIYKPREVATIDLNVSDYKNQHVNGTQELAVTVLDEAVFDLLQGGNKNFDIYKGFYHLDGRDLENYNLLTRLIGRQKFEKKGANQGGDGGGSVDMRTISKYVSYWNPSVKLDKNGHATVQVTLPDNLTSWRVLAMATTENDKMGLGFYSFKVNKNIEIRPVMPNQVTEGDQFTAGFTVMNRTNADREIEVAITAKGAVENTPEKTETIKAKPFERQMVWLPIKTKGDGKVDFQVTATSQDDSDGLEYSVPVGKYRSLIMAANYGTTVEKQITDTIQVPKDIYGDVGSISMSLSPSVIANVDGAFEYVRDYPYWCWEQRLTKAIMAANYKKLKAYISPDIQWADADTLPQEMLDDAASFQAPSGGMTFWMPDDSHVSPYLSAYTALVFNWLRNDGYKVPEEVESKLDKYLQSMLSENVFPNFYNEGMSSSVRAVALAALAESGKVTTNDLQRYHDSVDKMDLFGKAHFLQAAIKTHSDQLAQETAKSILAQATQSGGKFQFNERWDDSYSQILATPLRSNCAILDGLVAMGEQPTLAKMVSDIPFKLVRMITQSRGSRTHFENTQENVFCLNALVDFSKVYESTAPNMSVKVFVDDSVIGESKFTKVSDPAVVHTKPLTPADVGQARKLILQKEGDGRVYYSSRLQYAPLAENTSDINAGIEIKREYSVERNKEWILLKSPMQIQRGELVRVDLYVTLPTTRNFVVVDDPVPGGLEPVNRDLATASTVDADKAEFKASGGSWWFKYSDWSEYDENGWSFYHKELKNDAVRFYSDYLPAGNYHLSYAAQAIAEGHFRLQSTSAEEMYDPDVFGKGVPAELDVLPQQEK